MNEFANITLSDDQGAILNELLTHEGHIFLSGRAGTGKSMLIHQFKDISSKNVAILAPTGIAALNIKGQTIHSFFKFPPKILIDKQFRKRRNSHIYQAVDTIVIDEVSMLRADMLDAIDRFLQLNRENFEPFGGVQMIFVGDMYQLPPVVRSGPEKEFMEMTYNTPYFFSAHVIRQGIELLFLELDEIFRQRDRKFISFLQQVRSGDIGPEDLEEINQRYNATFDNDDDVITLCSTNAIANHINGRRLRELQTSVEFKTATIKGDFPSHLYPIDEILNLKVGAQVMMVRNDPKGVYVNGTIGKISAINEHEIEIESTVTDESPFVVKQIEWEIVKFITEKNEDNTDKLTLKTETVGHFKQFPLKLAWAVTIHKSQGQTYDKLVLDLGRGAFAHGQTYVALSRARTMDGISLKKPIKMQDIILDDKIIEFYDVCRRYN